MIFFFKGRPRSMSFESGTSERSKERPCTGFAAKLRMLGKNPRSSLLSAICLDADPTGFLLSRLFFFRPSWWFPKSPEQLRAGSRRGQHSEPEGSEALQEAVGRVQAEPLDERPQDPHRRGHL